MKRVYLPMFLVLSTLITSATLIAQEPASKGKALDLGKHQITAPGAWKQQQPKSSIVQYEFASPAVEGDKTDGRMTVMAAGGSIDANVERWYGQFTQPDGSSTKERAKT